MGEDHDEIFFTEEDYEMFSLSRTHNIRARHQKEIKALRDWRDVVANEKEKRQARKQLKQTRVGKPSKEPQEPIKQHKLPQAAPNVISQKKPKAKAARSIYSLLSPNPKIRYPTFSRLTLGQHKKFLELQAKYGSKGIRVTTSQQSAEHQQWRQLGAQVYQDQQDFNAFAEYIAKSQSERYTSLPTGAGKYIEDSLKRNVERVESLPQHYAVLQTVTLNPGVPLPSDPTLQRIGAPIFLGKPTELVVPSMEDRKVVLKTSEAEGEDLSEAQENVANQSNCQKLSEMYNVDIALSASSLFTLVNNHAPLYEHQWEIPIEVKECSSGRVVYIEEPLMKHQYYPHDASSLYHNLILKRMLTTIDNEKYCKFLDRTEEDESECMLKEQEDALQEELEQEEDVDEFGSMSLTDLETFGSDIRSPRSRAPDKEEKMEELNAELVVECEGNETSNVVKVGSSSMIIPEQTPADRTNEVDPRKSSSGDDGNNETLEITKSSNSDSISFERSLSSEDSHLASLGASAQNENIDGGEKTVNLTVATKRKVVKVVVRRRSTSLGDDSVAMDETSGALSQESQDVGDKEEKPNVDMLEGDKEMIGTAQASQQKPDKDRMRLMSDSSDDGHNLVIMMESDAGSSPSAQRGISSPKCQNRTGISAEENTMQRISKDQETTAKEEVTVERTGDQRQDGVKLEEEDVSNKAIENDGKDEQTKGKCEVEVPDGKMTTRRSTRIRKQSSSDGNNSAGQVEEVPMKRKRGRPRKQPSKEEQTAATDVNQGKKDIDENLITEREISQTRLACGKDGNGKQSSCETVRSLRTRSRKDKSADSGKGSKTVEQSINPTKDSTVVFKPQVTTVVSKIDDANPNVATKRKGTAKKASPAKSSTPRKLGNKDLGEKNKAESTIDEIMRLQEKMLTRQKSSDQQHSQSQPQSHSNQSHGQGHQEGNESAEETHAVTGFMPEGVDLEHPTEGSWAYSLWKFGRLRLLTQSRCPGMLKGELVSVCEKIEYQSDLGLAMQTASDLTRLWLNLYLNPGSKFLRGRIDSRTSEILSWECLDSSTVIQPQQTFNPGMCVKVLYLILGKVAALSEGRYLLRHRPGDAHICIYQCIDSTAKNVRAPYDLHAAHKASQLMTSLPPTIPLVPLDPGAPYRTNRWRGCVPLTFPPCPPNFKHSSTQHGGKHRKKNKKKKR